MCGKHTKYLSSYITTKLKQYKKSIAEFVNDNNVILYFSKYKLECFDDYTELVVSDNKKVIKLDRINKLNLDTESLGEIYSLLSHKLKYPIDISSIWKCNAMLIGNMLKPSIYPIIDYNMLRVYTDYCNIYINFDGKNAEEVFRLPKSLLKILRKIDDTCMKMDTFKLFKTILQNKLCSVGEISQIYQTISKLNTLYIGQCRYVVYSSYDTMITIFELYNDYKYNLNSLFKYLSNINNIQAISICDAITYLKDYNNMNHILATNHYEKYPKNLKLKHDTMLKSCLNIPDKSKDKVIKTIKEKYKNLEYSFGNYCMRLPENTFEIASEGNVLHHCIGSYIEEILLEKTLVLFLRDRSNINESLVTVEIDPATKEIRQSRGLYNRNLKECEEDFLNKWLTGILATNK